MLPPHSAMYSVQRNVIGMLIRFLSYSTDNRRFTPPPSIWLGQIKSVSPDWMVTWGVSILTSLIIRGRFEYSRVILTEAQKAPEMIFREALVGGWITFFFLLCTLLKESWQLILVMVVVSHSWSGGRHNKAVLASCRSPASCYLILYQLWLHVGCHRLPHFHTRGSAAKACWAPLRHHTWHGMSAELNLLALFFFFFLLGSDDAGLPSWPAAATHAWQSLPPFGQVGDLVFIGVVK